MITFSVDGDEVEAAEGQPIAVALYAAGRRVLGRSVKYHRPRGPVCFSGNCDGCLMRVDGLPNVMTCQEPVREGVVVETQNVVGSARADVLGLTDWFFPEGMDHHSMFTQFKPINRAMQRIARRVAGIGRLPEEVRAPTSARRCSVDVVVLGGGPAGLTAAARCAESGLSVMLIDEQSSLGGHLVGIAPERVSRLVRRVEQSGASVACTHSACAVYRDPEERGTVLVDSRQGLTKFETKRLIVATGRRPGSIAVPGNDVPGVIEARGAWKLQSFGVAVGRRIVLAGRGLWIDALSRLVPEEDIAERIDIGDIEAIRGRPHVRRISLRDGRTVSCDALVYEGPMSAVYELAAQGGAEVCFDGRGFFVRASPQDGSTSSPELRAVGHCTGLEDVVVTERQAEAAAAAIVDELGP